MSPSRQRRPTDEELRAIVEGGTVESEVMSWLQEHDPDGTLLEHASQGGGIPGPDPVAQPADDTGSVDTGIRRPTIEEMHKLAGGRRVDPAVERWLEQEDDGSVRSEIERLRSDAGLLDELAAVHREQVKPGKSMLDAPTPQGYEVLREIDRGAQGAVFLARQVAAKRQVALKVLLQGSFANDRQRMRFEREVELVASLKHPNIVTLYDSGLTGEGNAFLAMEFIDGTPLNSFKVLDSDGRQRAPTATEKATLFIQVCEAVAYAHQRGIIHRDLKPPNILVDREGQPHILDFGLAKAIGEDPVTESKYEMTAAGEFMGTFAYASPEQVSGDQDQIDTRTDVYALGVIFYELLLGERPYRVTGSIAQMVKAITDEPPVAPRSIDSGIDQDVETILLRALDKDVSRRYQSPAALATDIRHWLKGEAIEARRDDTWYVARKFLRRHWLPVSAASAAIIVLAGFAVFMTLLWERADHFNRTSDQMLVSATQLLGNLDPENPDQPMAARSMVEVMQRWSGIINDNLAEFPDLSARLNIDLAENFMSLARYDEAAIALDDALNSYYARGLSDSAEVGLVLQTMGRLRWLKGQYEDSVEIYRRALDMRRRWLGPDHEDTLLTMRHLAFVLNSIDQIAEAEALFSEASQLIEARLKSTVDPEAQRGLQLDLADVLNSLAYQQLYTHPEEAIPKLERAISMMIEGGADGEADWRVAAMLSSSGLAKMSIDNLKGAEQDLLNAQAIKERNGSPRQISNGQALMAQLALRKNDLDTALSLIELARAERLKRLEPTHPSVTNADEILAEILVRRGDVEPGQEVIDRLKKLYEGSERPQDAVAIDRLLGLAAVQRGNLASAQLHLRSAWEQLKRNGLASRPLARSVARDMAEILEAGGQATEAQEFRAQAKPPTVRAAVDSNE